MLSRIEANLRSFKPAINELPERRASVLIPLLEREGQTLLLLTKRSEKLRSHSGQVSFPGGKQDEQDQSSLETALREAREEIGLESKSVRILGCLDQIISLHFYLVTPFVGLIPSDFEAKVDSVAPGSSVAVPLACGVGSGPPWWEDVTRRP